MKFCKAVRNVSEDLGEEISNRFSNSGFKTLFKKFNTNFNDESLAKIFPGYNDLTLLTFKTNIDDLAPGDKLVVRNPQGTPLTVVTFVTYAGPGSITNVNPNNIGFVVDKVNMTNFYDLVEKEQRLKELREKMEERKRDIEESLIYVSLAEKDKIMKKLLDEYNELK